MVKWESTKILRKQFGVLLLLLFLLLEFLSVFKVMPVSREETYYQQYMASYEGRLDSDKEAMIQAESERLEEVKRTANSLENDFLMGRISEEEYISAYKAIQDDLAKAKAFDNVWQQYLYAAENPEQRYMVSDLPQDIYQEQLDYILVLTILILSTGAFLYEHQFGMIPFLKTTANGQAKTAMCKMCLVLGGTFALCAVRHILHWFLNTNIWSCLGYPIQSLSAYQNSPYTLSIGATLTILFLLRSLGYMAFAVAGVICAELSRNSVLSLFIPALWLISPQLLFEQKNWIYSFPAPTGLMLALGYIKGDTFERINEGLLTETTVQSFRQIPLWQLCGMILCHLLLIAGCFLLVLRRYRNIHRTRRSRRSLLAFLLLLPVCLSGCGAMETQIIHMNFPSVQEYATGIYYSDESGLFTCTLSGEKETALFRDPFASVDTSVKIQSGCFSGNSYTYSTFDGRIFQIDLPTLKQRPIFAVETEPRELLMGLMSTDPDMTHTNIAYAFANQGTVFGVTYDGTIQKIGHRNQTETILEEDFYERQMAFDGQSIYFINRLLELKRYSLSDKTTCTISEGPCRSLYLTEHTLYFVSKDTLFAYDETGCKELLPLVCSKFAVDEGNSRIIYQAPESQAVWGLYLAGNEKELIAEEADDFAVLPSGRVFLLMGHDVQIV